MLKALKLGPTVFPIFFAMVVGNTTSALAKWSLEKGEILQNIEHLQASSSLASTITIGYKIRKLSFTFCCLLFVWSLSPLGGQASLRLLTISHFPVLHTRELLYLRDNETSSIDEDEYQGPIINPETVLISAIMASETVRNSSMELLNTGWRSMLHAQGSFSTSERAVDKKRIAWEYFNPGTITAEVTTFEERYFCHQGWFVALVGCSLVMLLAGVSGAYVGFVTKSPDILGYVSSLTRDNPYCPPPEHCPGSAMDEAERTRRLGQTRVCLQDVGSGEFGKHGHLSLTWADMELGGNKWSSVETFRLDKEYR